MINLLFSAAEVAELREQRFQHPHPRVQRKMEALLLKSFRLPHQEIAEIIGISTNTLRTYFSDYQDGGIEALKKICFHSPTSELVTGKASIEASFMDAPPATIKEAMARIEQLTGIKRGYTQVRHFLLGLGLKRRKTGSIPAKADAEKQSDFRQNELEPKLKEAREGKRALYFIDAAHFVHAPFLGYLWCYVRIFIKAPCGRMRFNVLGALDAATNNIITVTNETYINATSVCSLLAKIVDQKLTIPITLVLDNAKYQKCIAVQQMAASLNIELLYLPSYSPNLNLIERFWKFVKKECLTARYYPDFKSFHLAIADFIDHAPIRHRDSLASLLTHRFQEFQRDATKRQAA